MLKDLVERVKKQDKTEMAFKTGISIDTIRSIVSGRNSNPKIKTVISLMEFCDAKEAEGSDVD